MSKYDFILSSYAYSENLCVENRTVCVVYVTSSYHVFNSSLKHFKVGASWICVGSEFQSNAPRQKKDFFDNSNRGFLIYKAYGVLCWCTLWCSHLSSIHVNAARPQNVQSVRIFHVNIGNHDVFFDAITQFVFVLQPLVRVYALQHRTNNVI